MNELNKYRNGTRHRAVGAGIAERTFASVRQDRAKGAGEPAPSTVLWSAAGMSPRDAWVAWLAPRFNEGSAYITGTYSDDYGYPNGLMSARNVHKDFRRFLDEIGLDGDFICGVEKHLYRDVLHLHGIIGGDFTDPQRRFLKQWWRLDRGFSRVLPVRDGCASYVTKYALKGDTDSFDWRLS
jgi:hypothetical protein